MPETCSVRRSARTRTINCHSLFVGFSRLLFATAMILVFAGTSICRAQVNSVTGDQALPIPGAGHDYIHSLNEIVSPVNGSVSIRIAVPVPAGRGLTIPFGFGYDSNMEHHLAADGDLIIEDNYGQLGRGGWRYTLPSMSFQQDSLLWDGCGDLAYCYNFTCTVNSNYIFSDSAGATHDLGMTIYSPQEQNAQTQINGCAYPNFAEPMSGTRGSDAVFQGATSEACGGE